MIVKVAPSDVVVNTTPQLRAAIPPELELLSTEKPGFQDALSDATAQGHATAPITVLGVRIACLSVDEGVRAIDALVRQGVNRSVFIVNAHTLNLTCSRPGYREVVNSADLVVNDGIGVEIAARLQGRRFLGNLIGTDFIPEICAFGASKGYKLYLLGGTEGVAERARETLISQFPGLIVSGTHHGFFDKDRCGDVLESIRRAKPDILLVGFGNPYQEEWISRYQEELPGCVAIGVGALFDYFAGVEPRAPEFVRRMHCEWVFRLLVAPRKKWRRYILGNPLFLYRTVIDGLLKAQQRN